MKIPGKIVPCLLILHGLLCLWAALGSFSTNDEYAAHLTSGYIYWKTGVFPGGVHNPPLGQLWVSLPMIITGMELHPFNSQGIWIPRLANIFLSLGLLYWVYREGRRWFGNSAGILALATGALSPTLISNSALANLDVPITFVFFGSIVLWWRYLRTPNWINLLLFSLLLGAAFLTKVTAFYLLPICFLLAIIFLISKGPRRYIRIKAKTKKDLLIHFVPQIVVLLALTTVVINAGYRFEGFASGKSALVESSFSSWPSSLKGLVNTGSYLLPTGFVEATLGKISYASAGNTTFLLGRHSTTGWWWYYPVCLLLKVPIIYILLTFLALYCPLKFRRTVFIYPWLVIISFLFFAIFTNKAQIGIRHLLPIFPFAFIAIGSLANLRLRPLKLVVASGYIYILCKLILVMPYPLSYTSIAALGNGYQWLADSNYDWGQGNNAIEKAFAQNPEWSHPKPHHPQPGTFLIRSNHLCDFYSKDKTSFEWLRKHRPIGKVAQTGLLFEISRKDIEHTKLSVLDSAVYTALDNDWSKASELFQQAQKQSATPWDVVILKATLLEEQNESLKAYRTLRQGTRLWPDNEKIQKEYLLLEGKLKAEKMITRAPAQGYFLLANHAFRTGNLAECREWIEKAKKQKLDKNLYQQVNFRLICLSGNWNKALTLLQENNSLQVDGFPSRDLLSSAINPGDDSEVNFTLGYFAFQYSQWDVAAKNFLKALQLNPANTNALNYLGQLVVLYHDQSVDFSPQQIGTVESLRF